MSNFTFLKTDAWRAIYAAAARAESYTLADPRAALFYGRRAVELLVAWLYDHDPAFRRPYDDNLNALMADASFKDAVPADVRDKLHALRKLGNLAVHNRRPLDKAEALAARFGGRVKPAAWAGLPAALVRAGVLVNTTSLGMSGQPALEIDLAPLPSHSTVVDIVYRPLETPLLARATARGLKAVDGLGMLLHQAQPGFAAWFGVEPKVTPALRAHLIALLEC